MLHPTRSRVDLGSSSWLIVLLAMPAVLGNVPVKADSITEVQVTATRATRSLSELPRSITVLDKQTIEQSLDFNDNLGGILGDNIPGIAASIGSQVNSRGQDQIRGRRLQLVIDGVVQNNALLDFREEFLTLDPEAIERIEVIRGGTAIYGFGATGGVVDITTESAQDGETRFTTRLETTFQPTDLDSSIGFKVAQDAAFDAGPFDVRLGGSFERRNSEFDGQGNRIPSGRTLAEDDTFGINGRIGWQIDDKQRLEIGASFFKYYERDRFINVGGDPVNRDLGQAQEIPVGVLDQNALAALQAQGTAEDQDPASLATQLYTARYENRDLLGQNVELLWFFSRRLNESATQFIAGETGRNLAEFEPVGGRVTIDSDFSFMGRDGSVIWGTDVEKLEFEQPLTAPTVGPISPPIEQFGVAGFFQLDYEISDIVRLTGGLRYERLTPRFDDFVVVPGLVFPPNFVEQRVEGGDFLLDEFIGNAGLVFDVSDDAQVFLNFSQGFTAAEILRAVRFTTAPSVNEAADTEAQVVNNFEVGFRGQAGPVGYTLAGFHSRSDLGTTFGVVTIGGETFSRVERAPERIWGIEATADWAVTDRTDFSGTISWQDGERDFNDDGDFEELPAVRTPPIKVTARASHQATNWLSLRLQGVYSGQSDDFPNSSAVNEGEVDTVFLLDGAATIDLPTGSLTLSAENLLDRQYIPPPLQARNEDLAFIAGPGLILRAGYRVQW